MAKKLALQTNYIYVDTGAMYRAVTLFALREGLISHEGEVMTDRLKKLLPEVTISFHHNTKNGLPEVCLNGVCVENDIRGLEVSRYVSPIAALPFIRQTMTHQQQQIGRDGGVVMDGRDIGTVVFPNAELKIFVTASAEVRALRRYNELKAKGNEVSFEEVLTNVRERDLIDSSRAIAPLKQAPDALLLDNSNLTIDEQDEWLMAQFRKAVAAE